MPNLVHGGDIYSVQTFVSQPILDFSANINPLGLPPAVKAAAIAAIDQCVHYPDPLCRELRGAIAGREGVTPEQILCGNGAADVIFRLVLAVHPENAVILAPTFAEYEQALSTVHCKIYRHFLLEQDDFALTDSILDALTPQIDILFLCNPNNPTGQVVKSDLLMAIYQKCRENNIILVMDECFNDFLNYPQEHTLKGLIPKNPQLFILKAFTKIYAMAGLRLGYGISANPELLQKMTDCGQPWGVSIPAQAAGIQALKETQYLQKTAALISTERAYLTKQLAQMGLRVIGSHANYIFFRASGREKLREQLLAHGILIRSCQNYAGLDATYYRAAVRSHYENEILVDALQILV
nr:threonine-phosphate decarboxylase CobD [uncultured Caproiciproducens sp.]